MRLNCRLLYPRSKCQSAHRSPLLRKEGEDEDSLTDSYAAIQTPHVNPLPFARGQASKDHKASLKKQDRFQCRLLSAIFNP